MLTLYNIYRNRIMKTPNEDWQELMQQSVNDVWSDTANIRIVSGQLLVGSKTFANEEVQINSVVDGKTGNKLGDDYRKIIYKNYAQNHIAGSGQRFLGKYYTFDGFNWLTINTDTIIGSLTTATLQKCNNTLKWYDENRVLHTWACVFERTLSKTNIDWGSKGVGEIGADTLIKVQLNEETNSIPFNQRFLFNGLAFQVKQKNNHISNTYMELYLYEVQVQPNDDIVNNIANANGEIISHETQTKILPQINDLLQGQTQTFDVHKYVDGVATSDTFSVTASGPIVNQNYSLTIIDGNHFSIKDLLESDIILKVVCTNTNDVTDSVEMNIRLGGEW